MNNDRNFDYDTWSKSSSRKALAGIVFVVVWIAFACWALSADDIAPSEPPVDIASPGTSLNDLQQSGFSREDVLRLLAELHARGLLKEGTSATDIAVGLTPLSIVGPEKVEARGVAWLDLTGVPEDMGVMFIPRDGLTTAQTAGGRVAEGHAHFWSKTPGRYQIDVIAINWESRDIRDTRFLSHTIEVTGDTPDPPAPPPDPETDYAKLARQWLEAVPAAARNAVVKDPITGDQYTRQQAVGKTFEAIGDAAKTLRSIAATNSMLGTGLVASFGPMEVQWRPFVTSADRALAALEAEGVTATKYGAVLSTIGRALR